MFGDNHNHKLKQHNMKRILLISFMLMPALIGGAWAQDRSISGKVTSMEDGATLPGVNVILKGTSISTVTDIDGNYKLNVPGDDGTLVFSFINLMTKEIDIGSKSEINVQMPGDVKPISYTSNNLFRRIFIYAL